MLRAGISHTNQELDFGAIVDPTRSARAEGADEILAFTRALIGRTSDLDTARNNLVDRLGEPAAAAVAGAVGNFEMMNRLLDATGVPTPKTMTDITAELSS